MASRRRAVGGGDRQSMFAWADPAELLKAADRRGGAVVFEAAEAVRIARGGPPRLPVVRVPAGKEAALRAGAREFHGRIVCWSCSQVLAGEDLLRNSPGLLVCPGCGARLPFVE